MLLPLTAAAVALFYLNAIPVKIAFSLRAGGGSGFGLSIAIFESRFARKKALLRRTGQEKPLRLPRSGQNSTPPRLMMLRLRAMLAALRSLKLDSLSLSGRFCGSDAALTALLCGGASSLGQALRCAVPDARLSLKPDFSSQNLYIELSGMISIRVGHIMLAALRGAYQYGNGRLTQWINTRSNAS